ncbi:MAG: hypothetical protein Q9186_006260 [Xanthomendoza sp. 1 TL-2023]
MAEALINHLQAFQTEIIDCKDGYTILGLLGGDHANEETLASSQEGTIKPHIRPPGCYILWEYAHA